MFILLLYYFFIVCCSPSRQYISGCKRQFVIAHRQRECIGISADQCLFTVHRPTSPVYCQGHEWFVGACRGNNGLVSMLSIRITFRLKRSDIIRDASCSSPTAIAIRYGRIAAETLVRYRWSVCVTNIIVYCNNHFAKAMFQCQRKVCAVKLLA